MAQERERTRTRERPPLEDNSYERIIAERDAFAAGTAGTGELIAAAIDAGAAKPADIFRHCQSTARCAKCVCDLQRMIGSAEAALAYAAE